MDFDFESKTYVKNKIAAATPRNRPASRQIRKEEDFQFEVRFSALFFL